MKISNLLAAGVVTVMLGSSGSAFACHMKDHDGGKAGWMHHEGDEHHMGMGNLSPEHRQMVMDAMHSTHEKNMALGKQMHELHEKLEAELRAPKFNKPAFLATNDKLAALQAKMMRNHIAAFANVAGKLTLEERASFADMGPHGGMMGHGGMMMHHEHGAMMHHGAEGHMTVAPRHDFKLND